MIKLTEHKNQSLFLNEVALAKTRTLVTEYDGILAPVSSEKGGAAPYPGICDLLADIMNCETRVIAISARPAHEVASLLGMRPRPEIWGNDGLEQLFPDGRYQCGDLNASVELLRALAACEADLEREGLKDQLDVKLTGVTVHWRGLTPAEKLDVRTKAYRILQPLTMLYTRLRLAAMEDGLELRLPVASKGDAMRRLLDETPQDVPIAYLGHSVADEDLFRALNGRGLTILVRQAPRFSAAQIRLRAPDDIKRFFQEWVAAASFRSLH